MCVWGGGGGGGVTVVSLFSGVDSGVELNVH